MPDVENLFRDYVAEHREGGEADPRAYLAQLKGAERIELGGLIDSYLTRSPGREWDASAFAGSAAERVAVQLSAEWAVGEGSEADLQGWRDLLPALRNRAQVMRREVVARLAEGLGHPGEAARVGAYYHQMETGHLPAEGVSDRVLRVLGEILGESAEKLRAAGEAVTGDEIRELSQVAYTRVRLQDHDVAAPTPSPALESGDVRNKAAVQRQPSEIDLLFTGGPEAG